MKKFAHIAILVAGLAGLSACSTTGAETYGNRTAGTADSALAACHERVRRLEQMNKACYRK